MRGRVDKKRIEKLMEQISRWSCTNKIYRKNSNGNYFLIRSCCEPWLIQAFSLLVAWNGSMLLFWSRSGKGTWSLFSFPLNGRDTSLLFWLALLYSPSPFLLGQLFSSPTPFLHFAFWTKISWIQFLFSLLFVQSYSKSNSSSAKTF